MKSEIWEVINGFSLYRVSNMGRVYSCREGTAPKLLKQKEG